MLRRGSVSAQLTIEVITPLLFKSGVEYSPFEYLIQPEQGKLITFSPYYAAGQIPELKDHILAYKAGDDINQFFRRYKEIIAENLFLLGDKVYRFPLVLIEKEDDYWLRYNREIPRPFMWSTGGFYYPGSSIKGRLRSYIMADEVEFDEWRSMQKKKEKFDYGNPTQVGNVLLEKTNVTVGDMYISKKDIVYYEVNTFYQRGDKKGQKRHRGSEIVSGLSPKTVIKGEVYLVSELAWKRLQRRIKKYVNILKQLELNDMRAWFYIRSLERLQEDVTFFSDREIKFLTYMGFGAGMLSKLPVDILRTYNPTKTIKVVSAEDTNPALEARVFGQFVVPGLVKITLQLEEDER